MMVKELSRDGVQKDPILIERVNSSVLDGMHRLAAFASLEIPKAVCCSVEYASDSVTLGRWARVYSGRSVNDLEEMVRNKGVSRRTSLPGAKEELKKRGAGLAAISSRGALLPRNTTSLAEAFSIIRRLDAVAETKGWRRRFVPEDEIEAEIGSPGRIAVIVERISKEDVVAAARTGELFPCKTSMHAVDPRPVAVNFPITKLKRATTELLRDRLKAEGRLLPANSFYQGRRYKERLLVLNPA
jgi:hypothetical protein